MKLDTIRRLSICKVTLDVGFSSDAEDTKEHEGIRGMIIIFLLVL